MAIAAGNPAGMAGTVRAGSAGVAQRYYRRFSPLERVLHACLMLTFVGCALSGLPLIFADRPWAATLARILGGFEGAGLIHRICAAVMIVVFVTHVVTMFSNAIAGGRVMKLLWGPDSMVPQLQDGIDIYRNFLWFIGRGPRPQFDRWTYWEKFDYWAVFWGMLIIGGSGLLLWFPVFFSKLLPGWMFNIAALVHGEEALLAVGFIFTFHFFNGHLRPEKFPMDMVIFTGRVSEDELKAERPAEYARQIAAGGAPDAGPPSRRAWLAGRVIGTTAVIVGLSLVALILYAVATQL